ncbi:VOC family protein [Qingshengfaniella alkalisoli]|uniref:Glyoxalase n=1 Tax=Qingshengfaniella alkalisoli TaxID=2599296 RepID=A0A5B8IR96_9RHOB|nr:VOC family protein [Qingshengfaniella alkalisoli]QDY68712.1 glyoxalase [Qingshengfaniella alkalisoli]
MLIPATRYKDCDAALSYLTGVLGFKEHAVHRDADGKIVHAQLTEGGDIFMFGPPGGGAFDPLMIAPKEAGGRCTTSVYVVVTDIENRYKAVTEAGAEIVIPLEAQDYGGQSFTLRDPEGHIWTFGDYDPTKES